MGKVAGWMGLSVLKMCPTQANTGLEWATLAGIWDLNTIEVGLGGWRNEKRVQQRTCGSSV